MFLLSILAGHSVFSFGCELSRHPSVRHSPYMPILYSLSLMCLHIIPYILVLLPPFSDLHMATIGDHRFIQRLISVAIV